MRKSLLIVTVAAATGVSASFELAHAASLDTASAVRSVRTVYYAPDEPRPWVQSPWGPRWTATPEVVPQFNHFPRQPMCGWKPVKGFSHYTGLDWVEPRVYHCWR
jgi:hypothetical protein